MTDTHKNREFFHRPRLTLDESINAYARKKWPVATGAHMKEVWGLTEGQVREVLRDRAGKSIFQHLLWRKNASLLEIVSILEPVMGVALQDEVAEERARALGAFDQIALLDRAPFPLWGSDDA